MLASSLRGSVKCDVCISSMPQRSSLITFARGRACQRVKLHICSCHLSGQQSGGQVRGQPTRLHFQTGRCCECTGFQWLRHRRLQSMLGPCLEQLCYMTEDCLVRRQPFPRNVSDSIHMFSERDAAMGKERCWARIRRQASHMGAAMTLSPTEW